MTARRASGNVLMIAARAPRPGETKTRLGRAIGMERAARLYAAFLADLAARLLPPPDGAWEVVWTYSPPDADFRGELRAVAGAVPDGVRFVPQIADTDWGRRQSALLRWGHEQGYARTVLIASDSPQLSPAIISDAFTVLERHDVVLGRVHDGGYYLIGQRGYRELLAGVPMSTPSAADGVILSARRLGLGVGEVPATFDVDVEADLALLREHLAACDGRDAPRTWTALRELGLLPG
jgi:glycosyltransferase A (GT-A) superfamily protein (DUF2064 family)